MFNYKKIFSTLVLVFCGISLFAQQMTVTGKVTDTDGLEVIGGSILIKNTPGGGTMTDIDGNYSITVKDAANDVLVFSYMGMLTQEIKINGRAVINVKLEPDAFMLDEVVSIGYATVKRKDLTGSVASINNQEISKVPVQDVTQALAGRMSGVQVMQAEGTPGADISIRVRGGISITQSNEPLYIIDGFPSEDGMASLDPAEIETIDILKDASATAIYGARGANGVVVITTKNGSKADGKAVVTFDAYVGVKHVANKLDVLDPYEFVLLDYERTLYKISTGEGDLAKWNTTYGDFADIVKNYSGRKGIDWQEKALGRNALTQNYRLGISGNSGKMQYALSYSYFDEQGAMVYSGSKKHNIVFNMNHEVKKWLTVNARISYDQRTIEGMGTSEEGDRFNKMQHILQYRPTIGLGNDADLLKDEDPILADDNGNVMQNPLLSAAEETNKKQWRTIQANAGATIKIWKGLTFRNTTGMRYQTRRNDVFFGDQSIKAKRSSIQGSITNAENFSFQTSNVLSYNWSDKVHDVTAMLGHEYVSRWDRSFKAGATNFPNDDIGLADISLGTPMTPESSESYNDRLLSFFARVNYNVMGKYLFSASFRADGSSKFGKNNKWGYFPSVSAAWRAIEEDFIKDLGVFSDFKFRIGYGLAGNNRIGNYKSLSLMSSVTYPDGDTALPGYASTQVPNADIKWEANKTFNLGLDLGFFGQRLTLAPEFYYNKSSNLLMEANIPLSSGYQTMMVNAGETQNIGIDLTINSVNITNKNFTWKTGITFSHNSNKVNRLIGESEQTYLADMGIKGAGASHLMAVGQPLGQFYGYVSDGLYKVSDFDYDAGTGTYLLKDGIPYRGDREKVQPGMLKFKNIDGSEDGKITEKDRTVIGNAQPVFYGGINNTFFIKDFDLSIFFTYSYGNKVLNATKLTNTRTALANKNVLAQADWAHRWVTIDKTTGAPLDTPEALAAANHGKTIACFAENGASDNAVIHSWAVEDGSYLKLSNVTLGYNFPERLISKIHLSKLRLYITGNNLFTVTKYSGYDPEVSTMKDSRTPGVDFGAYPRSRSFVFGINVAF